MRRLPCWGYAESRLPGSIGLVLSRTEVSPDLISKILWDNAIHAFGEP
jgi:hypothetical protein